MVLSENRNLTTVTNIHIEQIMDKLKELSEKSLGFWTPHEVFVKTTTSLTDVLQS